VEGVMARERLDILVGGAAGLGIKTAGLALAKTLSRAGLHVFGNVEYPSIIRGDHNSFQVTASARRALANGSRLDVLLALDGLALELHRGAVREGGAVLFDGSALESPGAGGLPPGAAPVDLPLHAVAAEAGGASLNAVGAAAVLGILGVPPEALAAVLADLLRKLPAEALARILAACRKAWDLAAARRPAGLEAPSAPGAAPRRMLLTGNEALCVGAIKAGMRFYASYPMTPSSSILSYLAKRERELGIVARHAEDELAAAGMAVGAAHAGVRAMAGTSGGGFCLMTEFLGLAGMTETPVVFAECQRPGPSTGLPTRTEQGDLLFALSASQGEFPRIVIAPADPEECFRWGFEAFNLAERFQTPVILLLDKHVSESYWTCEPFSEEGMVIDRGAWADPATVPGPEFPRHAHTPSGVSPRWRPGTPGAVSVTTGDEHDEFGHITEDPVERSRQAAKRLRKLDGLDVSRDGFTLHGDPRAPLTLVGWGSTKGVLLEAAEALAGRGIEANVLQVRFLNPFPAEGLEPPFLPAALAIAAGATFVARGYSGDIDHLSGLIAAGIRHRGFAFIDVLQVCVSFNPAKSYKWYQERIAKLEAEGHDPADRDRALALALRRDARIPIGVFYRADRPAHEDRLPQLAPGPLAGRDVSAIDVTPLFEEFL
jgi:2-oxoglutarate ferredoxin oxidoreductase subunit alpha